jgi:RNA polymerase sigma-70 factor (ECF subfamily)
LKDRIPQVKPVEIIYLDDIIKNDNYKIIYGYLLKLTMNEELTKDITQEVMVKAILNIKKFKGQSKLSTWLISIASNLYKDSIRKNKYTSSLSVEELSIKDYQNIEESVINKDTIRRMESILKDLPYEKRMVFILKTITIIPMKKSAQYSNLQLEL